MKWPCKNFFYEKLVLIFCAAADSKWETVDDESTKNFQIPLTFFRTKRNNKQ